MTGYQPNYIKKKDEEKEKSFMWGQKKKKKTFIRSPLLTIDIYPSLNYASSKPKLTVPQLIML